MPKLASHIDHTLLSVTAQESDIERMCHEAVEHGFATICIPNYFVKLARRTLRDLQDEFKQTVGICTVAGYPLGYATTAAKVEEIRRAHNDGADEIDFVINLPAALNGNFNYVAQELETCITTAGLHHLKCKVIVEDSLFDTASLHRLCDILLKFPPDFVKTGTGYREGATVGGVRFLRDHLPAEIGIKAAGGIRDFEQAQALLDAGANRLGTSKAMDLLVSA